MNENNLDNKNCLITGATGGLGSNLAKILLKNNCNIFLTSRSKLKLQKLEKELEKNNKNNCKIISEFGDLTKNSDIKKIIKSVR